jgi:hypothetical protein
MSGKSFVQELLREMPKKPRVNIEHLEQQHDTMFFRAITRLKRLPGSDELLAHLSRQKVRMDRKTSNAPALSAFIPIPAICSCTSNS